MRKLILLVALSSVAFLWSGCATQRDQAQIEQENLEQEALYQSALQAINDQNFVLEASRVTFRRGNTKFVNPNTNFISLQNGRATVQLSFTGHIIGPNGIGGITVEGRASNINTTTDRRGNTIVTMSVQGANISARVTITLFRGSHQCSATVSPNFNNNRVSFTGFMYPRSESRIFRGRVI